MEKQQLFTDSGEQHIVEEEGDRHDDENEAARTAASLKKLARLLAQHPHDASTIEKKRLKKKKKTITAA